MEYSRSISIISQQFQQVEEDLDDIDVQQHRSQTVLVNWQFDRLSPEDHLRVNDEVYAEEDDTDAAVKVVDEWRACEESDDEENEHGCGQDNDDAVTGREIAFGVCCVDRASHHYSWIAYTLPRV